MTSLQIFAFVVLPLAVLALGYAAVRYAEWDLKRQDRLHPGE
jgi:hypothetical protein